MKGVFRTMVQLLFLSSSLQVWLLGIGLAMTVAGLGLSLEVSAERPAVAALASVLVILGIVTSVAAPIVLDALMFRAISAPHAVTLVPNGRLKLAVGALSSQLLMAVFIGLVVGTLQSWGTEASAADSAATPITRMASVFVLAFAGITLNFLGFYWASQFKLGVLWFLACAFSPRLIIALAPPGLLHRLFTTVPGLATLLGACGMAWLLFTIAHSRARQVRVMRWGSRRGGTPPEGVWTKAAIPHQPLQYSRNQAMRMLLLGSALVLRTRTALLYVLGAGALAVIVLAAAGHSVAFHWLPVVTVAGLVASLIPGIHTGWFTLRARLLWLSSGLGREALFRKVERQSWRMLWIIAGISLAVELLMFCFSAPRVADFARLAMILAIPPISGAAFVYVNLIGLPLRRFTYVLITLGPAVVIINDAFFMVTENPTLALPLLLAFQVIMVPVLRAIARRRWQNMDWLINNPNKALFGAV